MNALSVGLMVELTHCRSTPPSPTSVRVLLLTGAGRAFCAGLDLKEIGAGRSRLGGGELGVAEPDPVAALERFPGPIIGAINGAAVTGGFELALACDVLLASPAARFADTHARIGIAPGWGLVAEAQPRHRALPRARGLVHRQLGRGRAGRGLGLRQPRGAGRRS
jgi:enoyl-CoA hydratase